MRAKIRSKNLTPLKRPNLIPLARVRDRIVTLMTQIIKTGQLRTNKNVAQKMISKGEITSVPTVTKHI